MMRSIDDEAEIARRLEDHMRALLRLPGTEAAAVAWMRQAYDVMAQAADVLKAPRVYAIPGMFGAPVFTVAMPAALELPPAGFRARPSVWVKGSTVALGARDETPRPVAPNADEVIAARGERRRRLGGRAGVNRHHQR